MGEYIEREAAIAALDEFRLNQTVSKYATVMQCRAARDAISRAIKMLESLPADDVEPVRRCKECKHAYINSFSAASGVALCTLLTKRTEGIQIVMQQDDFCSYGEQKDGDE